MLTFHQKERPNKTFEINIILKWSPLLMLFIEMSAFRLSLLVPRKSLKQKN
jgi:hypothetical protein